MRRLLIVALLALPLPLACKHPAAGGDAGPDGAPSALASAPEAVVDAAADVASAATATAHGPVGFGPPAAGNPCRGGSDTLGCSADHTMELTCSGGTWRALQACRGAGACKGTGSAVACDVGNLLIGDPCGAAVPAPHCLNAHSLQHCNGGVWAETVCMPPSTCKATGNSGQAACK